MAPKVVPEVVVAATRRSLGLKFTAMTPLGVLGRIVSFFLGLWVVLLAGHSQAAILPEDRSDVMYHGYDGGGLQVNGPSVLVRKGYKDKVSVWGNYYVDTITSASIDVITTASEYEEERTEASVGFALPRIRWSRQHRFCR